MKKIEKLAVVGGGTAGLVSALILKKRFPEMHIDVIASKAIGIIGVGEGSTEHWKEFMDFMGIDQYTLIKECDATYKAGIMFSDWTPEPYMHSVQTPFDARASQYRHVYAKQIASGVPSINMSTERYWRNQVNAWFLNNPKESPTSQYHFNTHKLNEFLTTFGENLGINFINDEINDVVLNDQGEISTLKGSIQDYSYDFYIDSTGFKRVLMSKLGAKWISFRKYLKMKAAIAFPTPDTENYNMWTLAKAMDYGWMFRIPVWGRGGNGYIYDSDYITRDQAKAEAEKYLGHEIEIGKEFKFDPGALEKVWIKNCVAIGLSGSFVEPLEATSIGTSIQQAFILMHKLFNYDERTIDSYNKSITSIMENIRDFIALHYVVKKDNSNFWKDIQALELPDSLKSNLELWKHKLPIKEDFSGSSFYSLFTESNFIVVMHGLGLFDQGSIKQEYDMMHPLIKDNADQIINNEIEFLKETQEITHKMMISVIRDTK
jgi:flavin-dependent dehydrogenase